jgi:hypothetical protein
MGNLYKGLLVFLISMTDLIVMISTGKGTWKEVTDVINQEKWDKVYIVTSKFGAEKFTSISKNQEKAYVLIDPDQEVKEIKERIILQLKDQLKTEVAVNFISGSGKEHMALMGALISLGVGIRMVVPGLEKIEEV